MERKKTSGRMLGVCYILSANSRMREKKIGPYFRWEDPPMVLCMGLHMVLGHDGFLPIVFCRSGKGNYGYVLIYSYGLGFMNA